MSMVGYAQCVSDVLRCRRRVQESIWRMCSQQGYLALLALGGDMALIINLILVELVYAHVDV